jgi:RsiW-degrading membrane proteinase PrsW (M82 family)
MLWDTMTQYLKSWFVFPGLAGHLLVIGIGLAIVFGAIWLTSHWPPLFKKPWLWAVLVMSAFLTLLAVIFVQIPLQYYSGSALEHFWSQTALTQWLLLAGIPSVLISGLVQEGAKMLPIVFWWWSSGKKLDPKMGLAIGALAGAGFAIFEATWAHNQVFMSGWTWNLISTSGYQALLPFWDRFWAVAMHIAVSALVGYGLAKGKGWQFYLIAAALHSVINYMIVLFRKGSLTFNQVEILLAGAAALVTLFVLWLRWRENKEETQTALIEPMEIAEPDKPAGIDV